MLFNGLLDLLISPSGIFSFGIIWTNYSCHIQGAAIVSRCLKSLVGEERHLTFYEVILLLEHCVIKLFSVTWPVPGWVSNSFFQWKNWIFSIQILTSKILIVFEIFRKTRLFFNISYSKYLLLQIPIAIYYCSNIKHALAQYIWKTTFQSFQMKICRIFFILNCTQSRCTSKGSTNI